MSVAGARNKIPREQRLCRFCVMKEVETAAHFLYRCPKFEALRSECMRRVTETLGTLDAPEIRQAIESNDMALLCGDRLLRGLPAHVAQALDAVACDYLKLLGRQRTRLWKEHCVEGDEWRLK